MQPRVKAKGSVTVDLPGLARDKATDEKQLTVDAFRHATHSLVDLRSPITYVDLRGHHLDELTFPGVTQIRRTYEVYTGRPRFVLQKELDVTLLIATADEIYIHNGRLVDPDSHEKNDAISIALRQAGQVRIPKDPQKIITITGQQRFRLLDEPTLAGIFRTETDDGKYFPTFELTEETEFHEPFLLRLLDFGVTLAKTITYTMDSMHTGRLN